MDKSPSSRRPSRQLFLAVVFLAVVRFAGALAVDFFAVVVVFLAGELFFAAVVFFAGLLFASVFAAAFLVAAEEDFLASVFAAVFLVVDELVDFLAAGDLVVVDFLAGADVAADFRVVLLVALEVVAAVTFGGFLAPETTSFK